MVAPAASPITGHCAFGDVSIDSARGCARMDPVDELAEWLRAKARIHDSILNMSAVDHQPVPVTGPGLGTREVYRIGIPTSVFSSHGERRTSPGTHDGVH